MPAQSIQPNEFLLKSINDEVKFSEITLKQDETWSGYMHFYNDWGESSQLTLNKLTNTINNDIKNKIKETKIGQNYDLAEKSFIQKMNAEAINFDYKTLCEVYNCFEANPQTVKETYDFFKGNKNLEQGTYQLILLVYKDSEQKPFYHEGFSFTLYENNIDDIYNDADTYKYGFGIYPFIKRGSYNTIYIKQGIEDNKAVSNAIGACNNK